MASARRPSKGSKKAEKARFFTDIEATTIALGNSRDGPVPAACVPNDVAWKRLGKPRGGDWLNERNESGQTFFSYRRTMGDYRVPGKHNSTILLVPLGGRSVDRHPHPPYPMPRQRPTPPPHTHMHSSPPPSIPHTPPQLQTLPALPAILGRLRARVLHRHGRRAARHRGVVRQAALAEEGVTTRERVRRPTILALWPHGPSSETEGLSLLLPGKPSL